MIGSSGVWSSANPNPALNKMIEVVKTLKGQSDGRCGRLSV